MTNATSSESNLSGTQTTNPESQNSSLDSTSTLPPSIKELLRDDAPILALISLRENPNLATATPQELNAIVLKCRMIAATPSKQKSMLDAAAGATPKKRKTGLSAQKLAEQKRLADMD